MSYGSFAVCACNTDHSETFVGNSLNIEETFAISNFVFSTIITGIEISSICFCAKIATAPFSTAF